MLVAIFLVAWWAGDWTTADIALIPSFIVGGVLPVSHYEPLIFGAVVEEESGHRARRRRVCAAGEGSIDEGRRGAISVCHQKCVAMRIKRILGERTRNVEEAVKF